MSIFIYEAIESDTKKRVSGRMDAPNLRAAKISLMQLGLTPISLEEDMKKNVNLIQEIPILGELLKPKVSSKDLTLFTQQMATLLDSGVPMVETLFMLEQQTVSPRLKALLQEIRSSVLTGHSFSSALGKYPSEFPNLYLSMIKAGEVSGDMDKICYRLASLYEKITDLQNKLKAAMLYPAITLFVILVVIVIILLVVVPQFEKMFASKGAELPLPTVVLIGASKFVQSFWWALLAASGAFAYWVNVFRKGPGKELIDAWTLRTPIIGMVITKIYASRFVRTMATLLSSGVSLTEALVNAHATIDNSVIQGALVSARENLITGGSLSKPLEDSKLFPLMVTRMMGIGEQTGEMDKMMNKAADFLDVEVDGAIETLVTLIEPVMIVVLGALLAFVALALYLPLFDIGKAV